MAKSNAPNPSQRTCFLSLDGLSVTDCDVLQSLLPNHSKILRNFDRFVTDAQVLSSPQAVWAEILTGEPWFANGCVGYSRPNGSLNKLSVVAEKDLLLPAALINDRSSNAPVVAINIPLLSPGADRIWLSDGSLPINKNVSPSKLLKEELFADYTPRPTPSISSYQELAREVVENCLAIENRRLDCARLLFARQGWSRFLYRVSVFDHLTHLLGLNYLRDQDLLAFAAIKQFIQRLDEILGDIHDCSDVRLVIVSGYSHVACRTIMNLNSLLEGGRLLEIEDRLPFQEVKAERITAAFGRKPNAPELGSMEGCLRATVTTAASPIAGAVFINSVGTFADGCVGKREYAEVRSNVRRYLNDSLTQMFGNRFTIEEKPESASTDAIPTPEFMIHVRGVEFHNMKESAMFGYNVPRTTHSPAGFALLPKGLCESDSLKLTQLRDILK